MSIPGRSATAAFAKHGGRSQEPIQLSQSLGHEGLVGRTGIEPASAWVRTRCISLMLTTRGGSDRNRTCSNRIKSSVPSHRAPLPRLRECPAFAAQFHNLAHESSRYMSALVSLVRPEGIEPPVRQSARGLQPRSRPSGQTQKRKKPPWVFPGRPRSLRISR